MCGIVGYVGHRPARELLLEGLRHLEYRGYDSAGIAVIADGEIDSVRAVGPLRELEAKLAARDQGAAGGTAVALAQRPATIGIGHTRWATHGRVSEENAHPHSDRDGDVQVVVNGIVENYMELKEGLLARGCEFSSQTDAEVIAHLIAHHAEEVDLVEAVRRAFAQLRGHYAFVAMSLREPDLLVGARRECPLLIGRGDGEQFLGSGVPAFLAHTRRVQFIESDEIVAVRPDGVTVLDLEGNERAREITEVDWDEDAAEKGGYETFMLKEIHEQSDAVADTIADRAAHDTDAVDLSDQGALDEAVLAQASRIVIVACGTSYHAGLIGRYAIEEWARLPVEMDVASEYRYRNPVVGEGDLVIGISQSGETADTLAAMRLARERGATVLAITNMRGSLATRESDGVLYTRAGLEVGVAATKTFTCQVAVMYLLALRLAELRGTLPAARVAQLAAEIKRLPHFIDEVIAVTEPLADAAAEEHWHKEFFLYLGRHVGLPVALEGALKLKEISYIATDAYAAGEMKHGPIALLDDRTPVVCVATDSPVIDKVVSNMQEVMVRGADVIAITTIGDDRAARHARTSIPVPATDWMLQPLLAVIPLQLLAYGIAKRRGLDVDKPRNLAKTVTVE